MSSWGPEVHKRKVYTFLRNSRLKRGETQPSIARAMDWSPSKVTRVENGDVGISTNDLRMLLGHFEMSAETIETLVATAHASRAASSWQKFAEAHTETFLRYLEFEEAATHLQKFHINYVPGMLQTPAYAQSVMAGHSTTCDPSGNALRWAARERRQLRLAEETGPQVTFVLDEAAVRRLVGGPAVMRDQIHHLIAVSNYPKVDLRIVPFAAGSYDGMRGPFILLYFDDPDLSPMLYLEPPSGGVHLRDDTEAIEAHRRIWDEITRQALDADKSRDYLQRIEAEMNKQT